MQGTGGVFKAVILDLTPIFGEYLMASVYVCGVVYVSVTLRMGSRRSRGERERGNGNQ